LRLLGAGGGGRVLPGGLLEERGRGRGSAARLRRAGGGMVVGRSGLGTAIAGRRGVEVRVLNGSIHFKERNFIRFRTLVCLLGREIFVQEFFNGNVWKEERKLEPRYRINNEQ
jgi:hypothetical protein